ncbi:hypothetical protein ACFVVX_15090 [Kitasatospora sp. NPDC058170]|uniref:hypothetical protein n=1 Tax=Kitasatospora sp. NPDC058170 TaxID=3346364 RepID=UPI0036DC940F
MTRHPLALLRADIGISQLAYARLVSNTRAAHGNGRMAARREKVARWESGRVTPDLATQQAMAEIHRVSVATVQRLGWPRWLHVPARKELAGTRPIPQGTVLDSSQLAALVHRLLDDAGRARPGVPPTGLAARIDRRATAAEALRLDVNPRALLLAVEGDCSLLRTALAGLDPSTAEHAGTALVYGRTADLCGRLAAATGDHARAETYLWIAARVTASVGCLDALALQLANLATCHLRIGSPHDTRFLLRASRALATGPSSRIEAVIESREARAHALLGNRPAALRALERAAAALSGRPMDIRPIPATVREVDEDWLGVSEALTWHLLGDPRQAAHGFAPIVARGKPMSPFRVPIWLLRPLVGVHLQVGDLETAVRQVRRGRTLFGPLPEELVAHLRKEFGAYRHEPSARALLAVLRDR